MKKILLIRKRLSESIFLRLSRVGILFGLLIILFSSCYYKEDPVGRDGRHGRAYLALTWEYDVPDYLDAGTGAIPPCFEWNQYYLACPGYYTLYYEGDYWNGYAWGYYAWQVNYEIWANQGEPGGYYYDGADGYDTYFALRCSPYGPYAYKDEQISNMGDGFKLISEKDDEIVIMQEKKQHTIKVTYKKAEPKHVKQENKSCQ